MTSLPLLPQARGGDSRPRPGAASDPPRVRYLRTLEQVPNLSPAERERLASVADRYVFRANDYYLSLIDWSDPADPIRRLVIPDEQELEPFGALDASNEEAVTVVPGLQHKYPDTALLLCNEVCGAYCRYCFRKRLFMDENDEVVNDVSAGLDYIAEHPEITDVLLTGGDPLLMSTRRLREIIEALRGIPHVRIIRIGSKMPAFDPWRLLRDAELQSLLAEHSTPAGRIYLMAHFDHPRELSDPALEGLDRFMRCGVACVNQCPLIRGINDDAATLAELWRKLAWIGVAPYYLFQCRPTAGNDPYWLPIVQGWRLFSEAMRRNSGLSARTRFVMSHAQGKVEVTGVDDEAIHVRWHRARDPQRRGRVESYRRDDHAGWLDDLEPLRVLQGGNRVRTS